MPLPTGLSPTTRRRPLPSTPHRELLAMGKSDTRVVEHGGGELAIATLVPLPSGHVVGSGPIAEAIMAQGQLMGWTVTSDETVDAGEAFLTTAGPADAIVILSHDPRIDTPLLDAALRSDVGYVGAMGSRHTQAKRRTRLEALGHDETSLARIHGPVGLDLGSRTPAETAVAIAAEYLANRSGRAAQSLGTTTGPING
ncbi:MAG: XdhC family protein [Acidimicrobiales bacterium]